MKIKALAAIVASTVALLVAPGTASAEVTALSSHSWDPGLSATTSSSNDSVHAWGQRTTAGAWGTGSVNYQAGATASHLAASSGTLTVSLNGTYCAGGSCGYGSGTGYKGLVQFWNDPANFIAFGLIHDPAVSPHGITLMIEGAGNGKPVGGYWPDAAITGASHLFTIQWTATNITLTIDNHTKLGPYPVAESHPSISFLAAGRNTGDLCDTTFTEISFSAGSTVADPIQIPAGSPYLSYTASLTEGGSGTGYSAYINAHDASNNAISVGIQTDKFSPESNGKPYYIWERVQNGKFTFSYLGPASPTNDTITLKWWQAANTAVFYAGSTPIASVSVNLVPRLFFEAEGDARINGDSVNDTISNVQISAGNNCPTYCGLNGVWNTKDFNFYGLKATNLNGQSQNGASFSITGTVSGLPSSDNWDTKVVSGIAMIAQYWAGQ